jgi:hypothetical protein
MNNSNLVAEAMKFVDEEPRLSWCSSDGLADDIANAEIRVLGVPITSTISGLGGSVYSSCDVSDSVLEDAVNSCKLSGACESILFHDC